MVEWVRRAAQAEDIDLDFDVKASVGNKIFDRKAEKTGVCNPEREA